MESNKEYFAFISYQREDEKWAKWLQHKLEHYKLPSNLNGRTDFPKAIRPIFRDASELTPGNLPLQIHKALEQSKYLIVICSPRSAHSEWVNKEVETFISMGKTANVIPFIIEGSAFSKNDEEECFPLALRQLPEEQEILGANINEMGRDAAAVKVVACMFDVKFDSLWQRHEREVRRQRWIRMGGLTAFTVAVLCVAIWIGHQNVLLKEKDWKMMENQARAVADMANRLIDEGDSYTARLITLEMLPKDMDNPERPYMPEIEAALRRATNLANSAIFKGHTKAVNVVRYSSDGQQLLSCSDDGTVKLWDAQTGESLKTYTGHKGSVSNVEFCPDGKSIISYSSIDGIKVWNLRSGKLLKEIKAGDASVMEENKYNIILRKGYVVTEKSGFYYSPDKKYILISINRGFFLYNSTSYELIKSFQETDGWLNCCWYPDGQWILVYTDKDVFLKVNIVTNQTIYITKNNDQEAVLSNLIIDSKGELIAGAFYNIINSDNHVKVWNARTGFFIYKIRESEWIRGITFSEDSRKILTTTGGGTVHFWDAISGAFLDIKRHMVISDSPDFCTNDKKIVTALSDNTFRTWDTSTSNDIITEYNLQQQLVNSISYSPNGRHLLVTSYDSLCLYDSNSKDWELTLYKQDSIGKADYSPQGNYIVVRFLKDKLGLYNNASNKWKIITGLNGYPYFVSFSKNEKSIAYASSDSIIHIHDVSTGEKLQMIRWPKKIRGISFIDNGKQMVIATNNTINVWDIKKAKCIKSWEVSKINHVSILVSPDEKYVVTSSGTTIFVWDLKSTKCVSIIEGHISDVYACCFSPNGKYIVSTSDDRMLKLWDWQSGVCMSSKENVDFSQLIGIQFSPDGRHVVLCSGGKRIRIWTFPSLQELIDQTRERFKNRKLTPEERRKYYLE